MAHTHTKTMIVDADPHFSVDSTTREITYLSEDNMVFIQGDHNSERVTFVVPRYVDGHDLTECDTIQVHYINTSSKNKTTRSSGVYEVNDVQVNPDDDFTVIFTWLVSHGATLHVGTLSFVLRFACTEGTEILYSWNTSIYSNISVLETIDNVGQLPEPYTDVLKTWYDEFIEAENTGVGAINTAKEDALKEIDSATDEAINRIEAVEVIHEAEQESIDRINAAGDAKVSEIEGLAKQASENIENASTKAITAANEAKSVVDNAVDNVESAKTSALESISSSESTAVNDVNSAKTSALSIIDSHKTNALVAITEQKDNSKSELQEYGDSVLNDLENATVNRARYLMGSKFFVSVGTLKDLPQHYKVIVTIGFYSNGVHDSRTFENDGVGIALNISDFDLCSPITVSIFYSYDSSGIGSLLHTFTELRGVVLDDCPSVGEEEGVRESSSVEYTLIPISRSGVRIVLSEWVVAG